MTTTTETTDPFDLARQAAEALRERTGVQSHRIALTLGSGWGGAADLLDLAATGCATLTVAQQQALAETARVRVRCAMR